KRRGAALGSQGCFRRDLRPGHHGSRASVARQRRVRSTETPRALRAAGNDVADRTAAVVAELRDRGASEMKAEGRRQKAEMKKAESRRNADSHLYLLPS